RMLEDALEEEGEFPRGAVGILLGEPQHRVLDDVESRLLLLHREDGLLEGASLDGGEKIGHLLRSGQGRSSRWGARMVANARRHPPPEPFDAPPQFLLDRRGTSL